MPKSFRPAPPGNAAVRAEILHWPKGKVARRRQDWLAREEPLEIRVRGRSVVVIMRTPGHDQELAAGFLLSESFLSQPGDILEIAHCRTAGQTSSENIINVFLSPAVEPDWDKVTRAVFVSSSCGLCGKGSIEAVHQHFPPIDSRMRVAADLISQLPERLHRAQKLFRATGGLHAAAVFDAAGKLIVAREDVGRHNAVDKVLGFAVLNRLLPFSEHVLVVSGRASFEILQKALAARIPIICAVSAPSSLAVEFARESRQSLIGFLRPDRLNVYAHPERITRPLVKRKGMT
jgi:FdhD protein